MDNLGYFSPDYFTARNRFRQAASRAGGRLEALPIAAKGPRNEELTIDIAWLGDTSPCRALVHSSGLHGVEGFAGSAIQLQLLDRVPILGPQTALVLVHTLNPYGVAWLRRVNENNVDLNRNFRINATYAGAPSHYAKLDAFLNPKSPPAADLYYARAALLVARHGFAALRQSIVGGQYEFPKGLFFGGNQMEEGSRKYEAFITERLAAVEKAVVIDVHTGIGKFAKDLLLVHSDSAYQVEGGLETMIFGVLGRQRAVFIGQEFGTYSGMRVLHALREENRWHHYGERTLDHPAKRRIKEAFCPDNAAWRAAILKRGQELIEDSLRVELAAQPTIGGKR